MHTFVGYVQTTNDALLLFEACRLNMLKRVQRRLSESERHHCIRSGAVFVWDEEESGIRRWTDGKAWSASRIHGSFLLYKEVYSKPRGRGRDSGAFDAQLIEGGLVKKALSICTGDNKRQHLVSYYTVDDLREGRIKTPSEMPSLSGLTIPTEMYPEFVADATSGINSISNMQSSLSLHDGSAQGGLATSQARSTGDLYAGVRDGLYNDQNPHHLSTTSTYSGNANIRGGSMPPVSPGGAPHERTISPHPSGPYNYGRPTEYVPHPSHEYGNPPYSEPVAEDRSRYDAPYGYDNQRTPSYANMPEQSSAYQGMPPHGGYPPNSGAYHSDYYRNTSSYSTAPSPGKAYSPVMPYPPARTPSSSLDYPSVPPYGNNAQHSYPTTSGPYAGDSGDLPSRKYSEDSQQYVGKAHIEDIARRSSYPDVYGGAQEGRPMAPPPLNQPLSSSSSMSTYDSPHQRLPPPLAPGNSSSFSLPSLSTALAGAVPPPRPPLGHYRESSSGSGIGISTAPPSSGMAGTMSDSHSRSSSAYHSYPRYDPRERGYNDAPNAAPSPHSQHQRHDSPVVGGGGFVLPPLSKIQTGPVSQSYPSPTSSTSVNPPVIPDIGNRWDGPVRPGYNRPVDGQPSQKSDLPQYVPERRELSWSSA
ncbi:hypothetical protein M427DRAFT_133983 [Gonapodya prolifera JEL478]|uniref:cAMP-independent regulatory protein pac2 n=1 Tax=Gonapodya prolifera (strain JEL478) TaxID=1344416 RepID=A0A139AIM1_GONPJ|nr:hypothetical protein M427DRAFT_133983 [Gonapodya prolifera JEL478]|eukprot:KXS16640.1 hypothetical protein M427DRAFT_133983 [Gonapodya prolifera JEL478]